VKILSNFSSLLCKSIDGHNLRSESSAASGLA